MPPDSTIRARFWSKVDRSGGPDACWLWTATVKSTGYGEIKYRGVHWGAHRLAYVLEVGPIPDGMWVLHRCDNRRCVNPAHLFLGTHTDNMRDASGKGRIRGFESGENHPHAVLTADQVRAIRNLHAAGGKTYSEIGRELGIAPELVRPIVLRRSWRHMA